MIAGFAHAPITKGVLITLGVASVCASLLQLKPYVHLQIHPHLDVHHQYYRLLVQHLAFVNSSELLLALLLFYRAAVQVERTFGTHKFAGFLVVTTTLFTALQFIVLSLSSLLLWRAVARTGGEEGKGQADDGWLVVGRGPAGPWGVLFGVLYQYYCIIPAAWTIRVERVEVSDKAIEVYSLALLLALSQGLASVLPAMLGVVVSALYRVQSGPMRRLEAYRIPRRVYRVLAFILSPWIGEIRTPQRSWRVEPPERPALAVREARLAQHTAAAANLNRSGTGLGMPRLASLLRRRTAPPSPPQQAEPTSGATGWNDIPPETLAALNAFPRAQLTAAIQHTDGNPDRALAALRTTHPSHPPP